jgi:competence protein ComEA
MALHLRSLWMTAGFALVAMSAHALDVNQANVAELDSLKGMGPALSAKVLKAREQAPFQNWQDLMARSAGLGNAKAQQFSEQGLTVNGQPFNPGHVTPAEGKKP